MPLPARILDCGLYVQLTTLLGVCFVLALLSLPRHRLRFGFFLIGGFSPFPRSQCLLVALISSSTAFLHPNRLQGMTVKQQQLQCWLRCRAAKRSCDG